MTCTCIACIVLSSVLAKQFKANSPRQTIIVRRRQANSSRELNQVGGGLLDANDKRFMLRLSWRIMFCWKPKAVVMARALGWVFLRCCTFMGSLVFENRPTAVRCQSF